MHNNTNSMVILNYACNACDAVRDMRHGPRWRPAPFPPVGKHRAFALAVAEVSVFNISCLFS